MTWIKDPRQREASIEALKRGELLFTERAVVDDIFSEYCLANHINNCPMNFLSWLETDSDISWCVLRALVKSRAEKKASRIKALAESRGIDLKAAYDAKCFALSQRVHVIRDNVDGTVQGFGSDDLIGARTYEVKLDHLVSIGGSVMTEVLHCLSTELEAL